MASRNERRAFFGDVGRFFVAATVGPTALAAACAPTGGRERFSEESRVEGLAALQQHIDAVRDPNPQALAAIAADGEMRYLQAGRALLAAYNGVDLLPLARIALREVSTSSASSGGNQPERTLWREVSVAFGYERYALVERAEPDGSYTVDYVGIPKYSQSQEKPAIFIPYDSLTNAAAAYGATPSAFSSIAQYLKDERKKGNAKEVRPLPPAPSEAMRVIKSQLEDIIGNSTGHVPVTRFKAKSQPDAFEPYFALVIEGDGLEKVEAILDDAKRIAGLRRLRVGKNAVLAGAQVPNEYLTRDAIKIAATHPINDVSLSPNNYVPEGTKEDDPYRFIRIVLSGRGFFIFNKEYLFYVAPESIL